MTLRQYWTQCLMNNLKKTSTKQIETLVKQQLQWQVAAVERRQRRKFRRVH